MGSSAKWYRGPQSRNDPVYSLGVAVGVANKGFTKWRSAMGSCWMSRNRVGGGQGVAERKGHRQQMRQEREGTDVRKLKQLITASLG